MNFQIFFYLELEKINLDLLTYVIPGVLKGLLKKFRQLGLAVRPAIDNNKICTPIYTNIFRYKSNLFISSVVVCIRIYIFLV